jgi:DNA-binding winged helix-turn-helix (wHTH) protein
MYQAASWPRRAGESIRVVLVIDVPAHTADLCARTAELADEYAGVIATSIPGVRPRKAVVEAGTSPCPQRALGLEIDDVNRQVHVDGVPVRLAYREFELLRYLAGRPGCAVSREDLVREAWCDAPTSVSLRTVDTHVRRLRVKLGRYQAVLTSVRGRGYRVERRPDVRMIGCEDYSVAVSGPVDWQLDRGGLPVNTHPRPVAVYVAPGRYGA